MRKFSAIFFAFVCVAAAVSCRYKGYECDKTKTGITVIYHDLVWNRFAPLEGSFTITDLRKQREIKVELSVLDGFELNHIPIEIVITSPSGQKNILNKVLVIKDKEGKHIGKVEGDVWTVEQIIYSNKEFTEAGEYTVSIQNRTQYYELFKVKSLSFSVAMAKKKINNEE